MSERKERKFRAYDPDMLQVCFNKCDFDKKNRKEVADFVGVSVSSLSNYINNRARYVNGKPVSAKAVSVPVFSAWAKKYGEHGEPVFTNDPITSRSKKSKQEQITVEQLCSVENDFDVTKYVEKEQVAETHSIDDEQFEMCSELSAEDKKEIARYAIDQHYFFLKQLTGVI